MKHNLFEEIKEGFDALAQMRQGKRTLRTHEVTAPEMAEVTADEIRRRCSSARCWMLVIL